MKSVARDQEVTKVDFYKKKSIDPVCIWEWGQSCAGCCKWIARWKNYCSMVWNVATFYLINALGPAEVDKVVGRGSKKNWCHSSRWTIKSSYR